MSHDELLTELNTLRNGAHAVLTIQAALEGTEGGEEIQDGLYYVGTHLRDDIEAFIDKIEEDAG